MKHRVPHLALALLIASAAGSALQLEGGFELPFVFQAGAPARASEVNANFGAVADELVRLDIEAQLAGAQLAELEQRVDALDFGPRRLLVAPDGGDFASVAAALASIDSSSDEKPWLVQVAPGVYDELTTCVVPPFVHLSGSGQETTVLRGSISSDSGDAGAALVELREGARVSSLSLVNVDAGAKFTFGVFSAGTSSATVLEDVTVRAEGEGGQIHSALALDDSDLLAVRCGFIATGTPGDDIAVRSFVTPAQTSSAPLLRGCRILCPQGIGITAANTDLELVDCEVSAGQLALHSASGGAVHVLGSRMESGGPWVNTFGATAILVATSQIAGDDATGDPFNVKYVHCYNAGFEPIADGLGSDVGN